MTANLINLEFMRYPKSEMQQRTKDFQQLMVKRRSVRDFSSEAVPPEIIQSCLQVAGAAPSGANRQPWHFCVVTDPELKQKIRAGAEAEEKEFYQHRAPKAWLDALQPLGTNEHKSFLEAAPCLIVAFAKKFEFDDANKKSKNYYVTESACLAVGFLLVALHNAGLATLTHTPSPMKFLNQILGRPEHEKPLMIVVTGFPAKTAQVPAIERKTLAEFVSFNNG